jgi:hypothetical protein
VSVEGELMFDAEVADIEFNAHYIFIKKGRLTAGTELKPYKDTSKLTIIMHSLPTDAEIPIYGNKCIAMREGVIDLHGSKIVNTWTKLNASINP